MITDQSQPTSSPIDVLIIGGSLSGSSLALLLKRRNPTWKITVIEKSTHFKRRVGESTSEVGGCFLTRVLGLNHYLAREHIAKHGLRLWFNDGVNRCPSRCSEIGPHFQARFPTFQLDRATLDQHVLDLAAKEGCEIRRPASVTTLELNGIDQNTATVREGDHSSVIHAKWMIDASGKAAVIGRQRGTIENLTQHPTKSVWARFRKVRDLDDHAFRQIDPSLGHSCVVTRTAATNHLMGHGWWCWIIPLKNGDVSAGITYDTRLFSPERKTNLTETLHHHLLQHPIGRWMFEDAQPVSHDTSAYTQLAYQNTEICGPGWACVGDAAGFMDPLYSHGIDFIGHTTYSVSKIIAASLEDQDVTDGLATYQRQYATSVHRWYHALYHNKYHYLGDADLMKAAFLLDIATYFIGPVRLVYTHTDKEFSKLPYDGPAGAFFGGLMRFYNRRLVRIAQQRRKSGTYGKRNLDMRYLVKPGFTIGPASIRPFLAGLFSWWKCEASSLLDRFRKPRSSQHRESRHCPVGNHPRPHPDKSR